MKSWFQILNTDLTLAVVVSTKKNVKKTFKDIVVYKNTTERYHRLDLFDDTDERNLCTVFDQISTKGKILFCIGLLFLVVIKLTWLLNISLKVWVCWLWELLLFDIALKSKFITSLSSICSRQVSKELRKNILLMLLKLWVLQFL